MKIKAEIACYVINLVTGSRIEFELTPEEITDDNSAQFSDTTPMGRSGSIKGYNSSSRGVSFSIRLHKDYCKGGIVNTVNKLKALTYPKYNSGSISPPRCLVRIGNMINFTAVTENVSVTWMKPYIDGVYSNAEVSLSFSEVTSRAKGASDIERGDI